jgi:hypothetical protein
VKCAFLLRTESLKHGNVTSYSLASVERKTPKFHLSTRDNNVVLLSKKLKNDY